MRKSCNRNETIGVEIIFNTKQTSSSISLNTGEQYRVKNQISVITFCLKMKNIPSSVNEVKNNANRVIQFDKI